MFYLMQLVPKIHDLEQFLLVFNDLSFEVDECGYDASELIPELLLNHFGLEIEDKGQEQLVVNALMTKEWKIMIRLEIERQSMINEYRVA